MFAFMISSIVGIVAIFCSLFIKFELERLIGWRKKIFFLHLANISFTNVVIASAYYVFSGMFETSEHPFYLIYLASLEAMLPIYVVCYLIYEHYEQAKKKYVVSEDKKVLYVKPKYFRKMS